MSRLPTKVVEDIYSILQRYAEASPRYYDREGFIYSFGVIQNPPKKFKLSCMDGKQRYFVKTENGYSVSGKNANRVNPMIQALIDKKESLKKNE